MKIGIAVLFFALLGSQASAVSFDPIRVTTSFGNSLDALVVGEDVSIEFVFRHEDAAVDLVAVFASATGWDGSILAFGGGATTFSFFNAVFVPGAGGFGGIGQECGPALTEDSPGEACFVLGITINPEQPGRSEENDIGWDGTRIADGGAHLRIDFSAMGVGSNQLCFGMCRNGDGLVFSNGGVLVPVGQTLLTLTVIPEPSVVLLMGLGLGVLGIRGKRQA